MTKTADKTVIDPFEAALGVSDVRGRSHWEDAWHRLLKNRAAVYSAFIMAFMLLLVVFGPMVISWESDFTDWGVGLTRLGSEPPPHVRPARPARRDGPLVPREPAVLAARHTVQPQLGTRGCTAHRDHVVDGAAGVDERSSRAGVGYQNNVRHLGQPHAAPCTRQQ